MIPHLVFLLEERSAREMLQGILPRILPENIGWRFIIFDGKQDMQKQLFHRLREYQVPGAMFILLRDKDTEDCLQVKQQLSRLCQKGGHPDALVRIACHELESWYIGDLAAVETGLGIKGIAKNQGKRKFRNPDSLPSPSNELLLLTAGRYQKIMGSRAIGPHLDIANRRSNSFKVFIEGIRKILAANEIP